MRKTTFIILFTTMTTFGFSQEDWFGFSRFRADNDCMAKSGDSPDANDIVYVDYHSVLADEHGAFPAKLSVDGCHPNPDTYFIMEELVVKAIGKALK